MELITDGLLFAASLAAALYCRVLSAKLRRFTALETGMGGAIAVLSAQVDEMKVALDRAKVAAGGAEARLEALCAKGEASARRLELMAAALHDLPAAEPDIPPESRSAASARVNVTPERARPEEHARVGPRTLPAEASGRRARFFRRRPQLEAAE